MTPSSAGLPRPVVVALARYRQRWGLTLDQLAERTDVGSVRLSRFEEGVEVPTPDEADALVAGLQLDDVTAVALRAAAEGRDAAARAEPPAAGRRFAGWDAEPVCHITTIGRRSGRPHESACPVFVVDGDRLFLLDLDAGGARWVRDVAGQPGVSVRVRPGTVHTGRATVVDTTSPQAERARVLAGRKYPAQRDAIGAATVVIVDRFEAGA